MGRPAGRYEPCFAFYDWRGTGFLMCQDESGRPVAAGVYALNRWHELGEPYVATYSHAITLGLVRGQGPNRKAA